MITILSELSMIMSRKQLPQTSSDTQTWALQRASQLGLLTSEDQIIFFVDLDILDSRLDHLTSVFPSSALHAIPVKTHPLMATLKHIADRGYGLECASLEEMFLAQAAGVPNEKIVWDSPAKTPHEIDICCAQFRGATVNANSIAELNLYPDHHGLRLGLRILPMTRSGAPDIFDVGAGKSKFGEPITHREEIIQAFIDHSTLTGIHLHAGSDIEGIAQNAHIVAHVHQLIVDIDRARQENGLATLSYFDIGGGASVKLDGTPSQTLDEYAQSIDTLCSGLFQDKQIVTEFGRFTYAHCGWTYSKVADIRTHQDNQATVIIHAGADAFVREVYQSTSQAHGYLVIDENHEMVHSDHKLNYDIGGPLCFAGDYIERDVELAAFRPNDALLITNTGSNSLAMWSRHCSRRMPKVIHYQQSTGQIWVSKEAETYQDIIRHWS